MSVDSSPVEIARAFTQAWTSHDLDSAAGFLASDVLYDGPVNRIAGAEDYIEALGLFAHAVTGLEIIAAFGDDEQAMIMYELSTGPFGSVRCGEHITVRDGKIQTDLLVLDTFPIRNVDVAASSD